MERVAADVETFHLGVADLDAFLVDPRVEGALDFEPGLDACRRNELDDGSVVCERPAAAITLDSRRPMRRASTENSAPKRSPALKNPKSDMNIIEKLEAEHAARLPGAKMPDFQPGDTVVVNVKVAEGDRTRIQAYEGVCIARSGSGLIENFTVARFPTAKGWSACSPSIRR